MPLHVQSQVVRPRESSVTQLTVEGLVARMFPLVSCQLVTSGESPATIVPAADVGLLPRMSAQMRL